MWRRLPHAHKHGRTISRYELGGPPAQHASRCQPDRATSRAPAARCPTLGADRDAMSRSAGTTSSTRTPSTCRRSTSTRTASPTRDFLAFIAGRRLRAARALDDEGWSWRAGRAHRSIRRSGSTVRRACGMVVARHVRGDSAAAGSGRSTSARRRRRRSRAGRDAGCRPRPSIHRAAFGTPDGRGARVPVGRSRRRRPTRGNFDFRQLGAGAGRGASRRRERVGRARSRRQRMGVDVDESSRRSPASCRWRPIPSTRPSSSTASTSCMKGASPATAKRAGAPQLPQLVPRQLSLRVCQVPHRVTFRVTRERRPDRSRHFRRRRRRDLSADAEAAAVEVSLRRARLEPVRCDLPAAVVSHHARRDARCSPPRARRSSRAGRCASRAARSSSWAAATARSWCCSPKRCRRAAARARVHLIDISSQALEQTEQRLGAPAHFSVVGHQSTYEEGLRARSGRA